MQSRRATCETAASGCPGKPAGRETSLARHRGWPIGQLTTGAVVRLRNMRRALHGMLHSCDSNCLRGQCSLPCMAQARSHCKCIRSASEHVTLPSHLHRLTHTCGTALHRRLGSNLDPQHKAPQCKEDSVRSRDLQCKCAHPSFWPAGDLLRRPSVNRRSSLGRRESFNTRGSGVSPSPPPPAKRRPS